MPTGRTARARIDSAVMILASRRDRGDGDGDGDGDGCAGGRAWDHQGVRALVIVALAFPAVAAAQPAPRFASGTRAADVAVCLPELAAGLVSAARDGV